MSYKKGKTKFLGLLFNFKDGTQEIIKPHKKVKKEIEKSISNYEDKNCSNSN